MSPDIVPDQLKNSINYKILALIFVSALSFKIILYILPDSENQNYELLISIISFINPLAASIASFFVWTRYSGSRIFGRAYFSLGMAYLMVFAAELTYLVYDLVLNADPYPSIADIFFFALYPFTMIHLILNIKFFKSKIIQTEKKWLFIIPIAIITIYIISFQYSIPEGVGDSNSFDFYYGLIFTTASAITLTFAILGAKIFREGALGTVWLLLVIGILANTIGDVWYYHLEIFGHYDLMHPVNIFWYSSYWLIVYALYKHKDVI
jgi:hypothetical protein